MSNRRTADVQLANIDERVLRILQETGGRITWGDVDQVAGDSASVFVEGSAVSSPGYRWYGQVPVGREGATPGDKVLLWIGPAKGRRFILAVDRAIAEATETPDEEVPDDTQGPLTAYMTHNTGTADDGKWAMMAAGTIAARYGQLSGKVDIGGGGATDGSWPRGMLHVRIKQQAALGSQPDVKLELDRYKDVKPEDFVLVVTSVGAANVGPTTFELYCRVTAENTWLQWTPFTMAGPYGVAPQDDTFTVIWTPCPAFVASLPAGTQYSATAFPLSRMALYAYPPGMAVNSTLSTDQALAINGGSCLTLITVPAGGMLLYSCLIRQVSTASARSGEWRLFEDLDNLNGIVTEVPGANGTWSFTPSAASDQESVAASPGLYLPAGTYLLVVRNTHGTNTLGLGMAPTNSFATTFQSRTKTLGSALGATLDVVTSWTANSRLTGAMLRGLGPGQVTPW